jgi:hypothetical protein
VDKNGNTQQYTLVVNKAPAAGCQITDFFFKEYPYAAVALNEDAGTIAVQVPYGTTVSSLTPVISILGKNVVQEVNSSETPLNGSPLNFSSPQTFKVYPQDSAVPPKEYTVTVTAAADNEAEITRFAIDGYPDIQVTVTTPGGSVSGTVWPDGAIIGQMPYGVSLSNLKPLIQFKGDRIEPASELSRNFNGTVSYKVIAQDGSTRTYRVTLTNKPGNTDTGIFNFVITNVSNAKVVIGQNPRSGDGRIPIVIQVPYGTNETNLIPEITLTNSSSTVNPASRARIPFGNGGNNQEAVYRVTAQVPSVFQEYVVVVSEDIQYYYVNGLTGRDDWPDIYNGGSESYPFKTLAYAVHKASQYPTINKVFVNGELNNTTEGGAWENASEGASGFHPSGGTGSVFNLIGTNKPITISGISNATLRGIAGKRVISLTGGADITFENITITGGNTQENGGGIFISGSSKIKFSGGSIIGNTGANGGGVYVNDDTSDGDYDFTLVNGSVTGNTATASSASTPIAGGGGIYTNNYALVWLAGGTVSNNTTAGSGGGILINGQAENIGGRRGDEYGLLMSGGAVSNNRSNGGSSPHGGGGVYVAKGVFEMLAGQVNGNNSVRQGGGVFVWHNARFSASGTSSITNNEGVGSSKAICSRGYTEMMGKAQADKIYIWNNNPVAEGSFANEPDTFTLAENARAVGIVLAYDDTSPGPQTRNFINILAAVPGTDPICSIDLEGHLTNYQFKDTNLNDWIGKTVLKVSTGLGASQTSDLLARFPLNTFVGGSTVSLAPYKLERETSGSISVILKKK